MPKDLKKGVGQLLVKRLLKITVTGGSVRSEMPGQLSRPEKTLHIL